MKHILLFSLIFTGWCAFAQEEKLAIQGKILDVNGTPIPDVYIVNLVSNEKDISLKNGVFTILISPGDSLVLSHISFFRKMVTAHTLYENPVITLDSEFVIIDDIVVTADDKTDLERAIKNLEGIDWDPRPQPADNYTEGERAHALMAENNRVLQTEAASVSLLRFSVSDILRNWKKKRKKRKFYKTYIRRKKLKTDGD